MIGMVFNFFNINGDLIQILFGVATFFTAWAHFLDGDV
jgi:phage shock protein PspC (stress-responsive transcriptional regulator)